ncbi:MAG: ANTAR domain-containing protein [Provencibacterium sp.]|jgi:AmiR/NasT family two-component response regulator|nr:ANTAR domain-containing protein [Provencibacterium sp.]
MPGVLIVSGPKALGALTQMLQECARQAAPEIFPAQSGAAARRLLCENDYELVLINAPLSDEFGHDLALHAVQCSQAGVLLIVRNEQADAVAAKVEDEGVFILGRPLSRELFYQAVKLVKAARRRLMGMQQENRRLQGKIEEIRLCGRAKCALIQYCGYTEPQAHRYMEKQAMDERRTRREIAEEILKIYEG